MSETLLPRNATDLERVIEEGMQLRYAVLDTEPPALVRRPDAIAAAHLPHLAWEVDVPVWRADLVEAERRTLIAQSPDLHRLAGTQAGTARLLSWANATLERVRTRRNRAFAGPTPTDEERAAWLDRLPQMRRYAYRTRGRRHATLRRPFPRFLPLSTAPVRFGQRITLYRNGIETDLKNWTVETSETARTATTERQVAVPGKARGTFAGRRPGLLVASTAGKRLYRLQETATYLDPGQRLTAQMIPIPDGLTPAVTQWQPVAGEGRRAPQASSRFLHFLPESRAADRLYHTLPLADPGIVPAPRARGAYCTRGRLDPSPWRADFLVAIRGKRRGVLRHLHGVLAKPDRSGLAAAREALAWGQPAAARWLLDPRTRIPALAGRHSAGSLKAGALIEAR